MCREVLVNALHEDKLINWKRRLPGELRGNYGVGDVDIIRGYGWEERDVDPVVYMD